MAEHEVRKEDVRREIALLRENVEQQPALGLLLEHVPEELDPERGLATEDGGGDA